MYGILMDLLLGSMAGYGVHHYRNYWLHRPQRFMDATFFDGTLYQAGATDIIKREARDASAPTVICFPGFMENQHYFLELYQDANVEFIALNNADYFSGLYAKSTFTPDWNDANPHAVATIEHDAHLLCQVIENLATRDEIILHGHSRGGAVILELARQRPDLAERVTALLEAPLLPKAKPALRLERFARYGGLYLFPLYLGAMSKLPTHRMITERSHYPLTPRKRELLAGSARLPKRYSTALRNMLNIRDWQSSRDFDLYPRFKEVRIVLPEKDDVLCRTAMRWSAEQGSNVRIIETRDTNHFISLEQPHTMRAALGLV
jgi:pimeloyl-ACP methyl ester carboxylesterase